MKRLFVATVLCFQALCSFTQQQTFSYVPGPEKAIELNSGILLRYVEQGDKKGVPVILLHGFTDSWKSFEAVLPELPSAVHVFAISQRGHGNSSKSARRYHPEDFAKDIADFIKKKKLGAAVIVGHSMGSFNAQCFATKYPELTKALVLIGTFADFNKPLIDDFRKTVNELNDPIDSVFIAEFQKSTIVKPIREDMLIGYINESRKLPAHVWKGVAAGWEGIDYTKALQSFSKPVLIVWGDKDAYCPKEDQEILNKAMKNSKLLVYEGIGHAVHWEDPERFAKDLVQFIDSLK